jgi:hypothetical protein
MMKFLEYIYLINNIKIYVSDKCIPIFGIHLSEYMYQINVFQFFNLIYDYYCFKKQLSGELCASG